MPTITVRNQRFDVMLDQNLHFSTTLNGEKITAESRYALEKTLARKLKLATVEYAIPVVMKLDNGRYGRCILRGRNIKTGAILGTGPDGQKFADNGYSSEILNLGGAIADGQITKLNELCDAVTAAVRARDEYAKTLQPAMDVRKGYRPRLTTRSLIEEAEKATLAKAED